MGGKLSPKSMPVRISKEVLENGKKNLPSGNSFPCGKDIYSCYDIILAEAITDGSDLVIVFAIPYSSADSILELHSIVKYPVFDSSSGLCLIMTKLIRCNNSSMSYRAHCVTCA
jgi:hypothetical protein